MLTKRKNTNPQHEKCCQHASFQHYNVHFAEARVRIGNEYLVMWLYINIATLSMLAILIKNGTWHDCKSSVLLYVSKPTVSMLAILRNSMGRFNAFTIPTFCTWVAFALCVSSPTLCMMKVLTQ